MRSIFTDHPTDPEFGVFGGAYDDVNDSLDTSKLSVFRFKDDTDTPVYQDLFITNITEGFSEGHHLIDVFGDSFVDFSFGANPIGVTIQGYLVKLKEYDSRADFLDVYEKKIRGTAVQSADRELQFLFNQTTRFIFYIQQLQVAENAQLAELTGVSMQGISFDYEVVTLPTISNDSGQGSG
jgi:hypothetical protein